LQVKRRHAASLQVQTHLPGLDAYRHDSVIGVLLEEVLCMERRKAMLLTALERLEGLCAHSGRGVAGACWADKLQMDSLNVPPLGL
jgi:hypothetical protein